MMRAMAELRTLERDAPLGDVTAALVAHTVDYFRGVESVHVASIAAMAAFELAKNSDNAIAFGTNGVLVAIVRWARRSPNTRRRNH